MKSRFLNKSKKYIAGFLAVVFVFNLFLMSPREVEAIMTVHINSDTSVTSIMSTNFLAAIAKAVIATEAAIVPIATPANVSTAASTKVATVDQTGSNWWHKTVEWVKTSWYQISDTITQKSGLLKEYVLDPLFWTMANVVIDQFGDAIVNWIRNGFEGSPMFLSDPEGFFRDTANQVSGAIIDHFNMEWLCDPLGKLHINLDFFFPGTDRAKYRCTFNDIAGNFKNISGRKDLSDWIDINVNIHQQNIVRLYGSDYRHGGLLMWLTTADWKNNDAGRTLQVSSDAYIAARASVSFGRFQLFKNGGFLGMRKCVEWESTYEAYQPFEKTKQGTGNGKCIKYVDTTPGQLVQDQLNKASSGDLSRLHIADEVDEIIGALASTLVGWMLTGGNDGGGILGYDKSADYSASNRDHFGALDNSKKITKKKSDISSQIVIIKNGNDQYNNALKNYMGVLGDSENSAGIVLAKLKCVRATSTNDTGDIYDDSACLGVSEEIQEIKLEAGQINEITTDINNIEKDIKEDDADKYDYYEIAIAEQTAKLLDEFESKVMMTTSMEEIDAIISEYCYSYDEATKTGTVCGLYTDKDGNTKKETHETHSEEEAAAIDKEAMNKVPGIKTNESKYLCILNKYTKMEKVEEGACKAFIKTNYVESGSSASSISSEDAGAGQ